MRTLHYSVVLKRELSRKAILSELKSILVPIVTYGYESWIMTKKVRSQMQVSEMRFLQKIKEVTMFDKHGKHCNSRISRHRVATFLY